MQVLPNDPSQFSLTQYMKAYFYFLKIIDIEDKVSIMDQVLP